jgi:hypothetical protein
MGQTLVARRGGIHAKIDPGEQRLGIAARLTAASAPPAYWPFSS